MAGTVQLDELRQWLDAMDTKEYSTAVNVHCKTRKLVGKAAAMKAGLGAAMGGPCGAAVVAEKLAQFLSNLYHLVRAAAFFCPCIVQ